MLLESLVRTPFLSNWWVQTWPTSKSPTNCIHLALSLRVDLLSSGRWVITLRPRQMSDSSQTIFSNAFSWVQTFDFQNHFMEICSLGSNWQHVIIGSDNGLAQNRRQAIIWTNDGLVNMRIYASLSLKELKRIKYGVFWSIQLLPAWFEKSYVVKLHCIYWLNNAEHVII